MVSQPSAAPVKDVPVRGRGALLTGLLASIVCVAFESVAVATAMPEAAQELGQVGLYAWPFTLFVLGMVFSTAVTGCLFFVPPIGLLDDPESYADLPAEPCKSTNSTHSSRTDGSLGIGSLKRSGQK